MSKPTENGTYAGSLRLGDRTVPASLTKNGHGWFCDRAGVAEWIYPGPLNPQGGFGVQVAQPTALEAVRGLLSHWPTLYRAADLAGAADGDLTLVRED